MDQVNKADETKKEQSVIGEPKSALSVNPGVADAPAISPYIKEQRKSLSKKETTALSLAEGILAGNRTALSKAITLVESNLDEHNDKAQAILELVMPKVGNSIRIGITGVPGVGKSTFIESFGSFILDKIESSLFSPLIRVAKGQKVPSLVIKPEWRNNFV